MRSRSHIQDLLDQGVEVKACSNSLESRNITEEDLIEGVSPVSSGVGELTRLQDNGYAYVRP
ncbi:hypothetical protein GKQ38_02090 [Candidatus Nanohaloarchaea archaeon]|nr:hypothetical protein GKQ38_02090 [Candidatus Nanohaloarchaea archaeon]